MKKTVQAFALSLAIGATLISPAFAADTYDATFSIAADRAQTQVAGTSYFDLTVEDATNLVAIELTFTVDSGTPTVTAHSDFTVLDALSKSGNEYSISVIAQGNATFSTDAAATLLDITVDNQYATITLENADITATTRPDTAVATTRFADTTVSSGTATYAVSMDVNGDNVVDMLDVSDAQFYFGASSSDSNWADAKTCDVNMDGAVNLQDLIAIHNNIA